MSNTKSHPAVSVRSPPDPEYFRGLTDSIETRPLQQYSWADKDSLSEAIVKRLWLADDSRMKDKWGRKCSSYARSFTWNKGDEYITCHLYDMLDNVRGGIGEVILAFRVELSEFTESERALFASIKLGRQREAAEEYAAALREYRKYLEIVEAAHELFP